MAFARRLYRRLLLSLMGADRLAPALRTVGRGLVSIFTLHRFADPELGWWGTTPSPCVTTWRTSDAMAIGWSA